MPSVTRAKPSRFSTIFFGSRVLHSIVQGTINRVTIRFPLFAIGWGLIMIMALRELF